MHLVLSKKTKKLTTHKCWYVVYTRPRHEKKIYNQLLLDNIDAYLPLYTTLRQWSDRKKKVSEPLFSCYLFVRITPKEYYDVLNVPGVVRYITFEGKAVVMREEQIQTIKNLLENKFELEETPEDLLEGTKVEIVAGPLSGVKGELAEYANKKRVIIRIEEINKSLFVNVPLNLLKLIE
jgi:transcriptional antiterminator RfaH